MNQRHVDIDARGQVLGRLATRVALALRGKDQPDFRPDRFTPVHVRVHNIREIKISGKKLEQKKYYHYSGYPGGLKTKRLEQVLAQHPEQALILAVKRMLPNNRLRARWMKLLAID